MSNDKKSAQKAFDLLESEYNETLDAITDKNIELLRGSGVRTEIVPKGKFLKSIYKLDPYFGEIDFKAQW